MAKYSNVYKRTDGRWCARLPLGRNPATGKTKYKYFYAATQKEAVTLLKQAEHDMVDGVAPVIGKITLEKWLDYWLSNYKEGRVQETTINSYSYAFQHVKKHLGKAYLTDLTTDMIQGFIKQLEAENLTRTIKICHCALNAALKQAVQNGYLTKNPAQAAVLPKTTHHEANVLTVAQQQYFLSAVKGERLAALYMVQLGAGLRPGEVLGLTWDCFDAERKVLIINKAVRRQKAGENHSHMGFAATKTKRSREIELTDELLGVLEQHRTDQLLEIEQNDKQYDRSKNLIFATQTGNILERGNVDKNLTVIKQKMQQLQAKAEGKPVEAVVLPTFTLHSLRHTFATRAMEKGIPLKVVSQWLGHSTVRVTGDTYSHALPEMRQSSMRKMEGMLNL